MKHALFIPSDPKVLQIINCIGYVELHENESNGDWFGICPNGSSNLTISLNEKPLTYHNKIGQSFIYSSWNAPVAIKRTAALKFLNVQFKPFGLYNLKGIPMGELQNASMTLDLLFSRSDSDELINRILESRTLKSKFRVVEKFLSEHVNEASFDKRLPYAVSLIKKSADPTVDFLSSSVCLSTRRFRELFTYQTGFSPGLYKKLVRFNKASKQITGHPVKSLTEVALDNFYYDQSHFIKDFKFFAGITPSQFLKEKAKTADFYNFNLKDLSTFAARA